ncbi:MAG: hypothetical protein HYZ28_01220 [Myxococcales bacterium]|nr:hypothetical protein [Myxococcales bacterium]
MVKRGWRTALVAALALGGVAFAQAPERRATTPAEMLEEANLSLRLNGGLGNFTGDLDRHTRVGPVWGLSVSAQPLEMLGAEFAYEGSRNPIENEIISEGAGLWRNGLSAMAKVGPEFGEVVRPYVGAGFGLSYVNPDTDAEVLYRNDFMAEFPLSAGIDLHRGTLTGGVRATYRFLGGEGFADRAGGGSEGGLATATLNLGGTF